MWTCHLLILLLSSNCAVTRVLVRLTEQWNFGEPIQFKNGTVAYKMNVTFTSSVTPFNDVKSRRSYLKDEELSNVNFIGFVAKI